MQRGLIDGRGGVGVMVAGRGGLFSSDDHQFLSVGASASVVERLVSVVDTRDGLFEAVVSSFFRFRVFEFCSTSIPRICKEIVFQEKGGGGL